MARIDEGPPRQGRRPGASVDFPVKLFLADDPNKTLLEVDGQLIGAVKSINIHVGTDPKTGLAKQAMSLVLLDKSSQSLRAELVDRLHEMTDHNPKFDLELDIVDVEK